MSSLRLAVAAALAVLVSASPGAESRECAELGGCAVAPEGWAADHLLFQARAKMHKADTSAAEEGGEIHKSHKSTVEDSVSLEPVCQIMEIRPTEEKRSAAHGGRGTGRGEFLSDGYGIVGNVATAERCTQANCNLDNPNSFPFAADLFTPVHTEGEQYKPGLCACMRKGTEKALIKWETTSYGAWTKDGCIAHNCWYAYATAVYASEVKDWINPWQQSVINGYVESKKLYPKMAKSEIIKQKGWEVGCVTIADQQDPIEQENLMTVEGMLDKVGEHRGGMCSEGVGITRGRKSAASASDGLWCLRRDSVLGWMKTLVPGLKIEEKKPVVAPSEPEVEPQEPEPEPRAPLELCAKMGEVESKMETCGKMIAEEMNRVSDVQQAAVPGGHEQFLSEAMEVIEAAVTDEIHGSLFKDVLKELTILKEEEARKRADSHKYTELDSDMAEFTHSRTDAKQKMKELRTAVGELPQEFGTLQNALDPVMEMLGKAMHDVLKGASIMQRAKHALTCP